MHVAIPQCSQALVHSQGISQSSGFSVSNFRTYKTVEDNISTVWIHKNNWWSTNSILFSHIRRLWQHLCRVSSMKCKWLPALYFWTHFSLCSERLVFRATATELTASSTAHFKLSNEESCRVCLQSLEDQNNQTLKHRQKITLTL